MKYTHYVAVIPLEEVLKSKNLSRGNISNGGLLNFSSDSEIIEIADRDGVLKIRRKGGQRKINLDLSTIFVVRTPAHFAPSWAYAGWGPRGLGPPKSWGLPAKNSLAHVVRLFNCSLSSRITLT